jgi:pimeloyl-ACP methyl ester carboxylesterase
VTPQPLTPPIIIVLVMLVIVALCIRRLRALRHSTLGKARRTTERILLSCAILLCVVLACTTSYNAAALRYYQAIYPPPGKLYRVDGYDMHLYCTGEGAPTLILEAGAGADSITWVKVQPELSKITRVCSYDRSGYGWSEPRPSPRDADTVSQRLHSLLQQAGITGPLVLMGHSMGGIYIRDYASHYPQGIEGLVFLDPGTPTMDEHESPELRAATAIRAPYYYSLAALIALGLHRPAGFCAPEPGMDLPTGTRFAQLECGKLLSSIWSEYKSEPRSEAETMNTGPYGALPVLIISRDTKLPGQTQGLTPKLAAEFTTFWDQEQEDLKHLSTRSRRIIAKGSGHQIQSDRADLVNREVAVFIQQIRSNERRTDYGSTMTE